MYQVTVRRARVCSLNGAERVIRRVYLWVGVSEDVFGLYTARQAPALEFAQDGKRPKAGEQGKVYIHQ